MNMIGILYGFGVGLGDSELIMVKVFCKLKELFVIVYLKK